MRRAVLVASCVLAAGGCKSRQDGLPPATEWSATAAADEPPPMMPGTGAGRGGANPHAGLDMAGGDPHAGLDLAGGDPHAGLDLSGGGNPHGGGTDVSQLGLAGPDPNRKLDPTHRLTGVITVEGAAKDRVKPGTAIFVIVKRAGGMGPVGAPLAVDKLTWRAGGVPFELTDAQAMIAGTDLTGDVYVSARYDQDSDAISKQPGDVTGQVKVRVPAEHIELKLETVLP